ncbi:alpha/beta hydrolase family protein [Chitinophaga silvatica]|uniref:alpha/beta hydrolase family protein n=1 Tax=Chitinophaga silvatica TaxID=2282649 RepID=UPI00131426E3|nr:alpha/beta hydrolase [Chitinophaga silvatica]
MKKFIKLLLVLFLFIAVVSLYANYLHPHFFFKKVLSSKTDTAFLNKGKDISFRSGDAVLKGKIFTNASGDRKIPLIVFCVGSGDGSTISNYAKMIDTLFLQNLPMDSIAVLCFEKRGLQASEGDWYTADFEQRAADAKSAADFAATLPYIDPHHIAIAGHSQGGWITQVGLAQYPEIFSAGISLAGPVFPVRQQLVNDYVSQYHCAEGLNEADAMKKAERQVSMNIFITRLFPFQPNWKQLQVIKDFDPGIYLKKINSPILFLWGSNDPLVSPEWCKASLKKYFPGNIPGNFDTLTITGASHSFKLADLCYHGPSSQVPYAPECKEVLLNWVRKKLL